MVGVLILLGICLWIFGVVWLATTRAWWVLPPVPAIGGIALLANLPEAHGEAGVVAALASGIMLLLAMGLFAISAIALYACSRASARARDRQPSPATTPLPAAVVIDARSSSDAWR